MTLILVTQLIYKIGRLKYIAPLIFFLDLFVSYFAELVHLVYVILSLLSHVGDLTDVHVSRLILHFCDNSCEHATVPIEHLSQIGF